MKILGNHYLTQQATKLAPDKANPTPLASKIAVNFGVYILFNKDSLSTTRPIANHLQRKRVRREGVQL